MSAFLDCFVKSSMFNFISSENGIAINGILYSLQRSSKNPKVGLEVKTLVCFEAKFVLECNKLGICLVIYNL